MVEDKQQQTDNGEDNAILVTRRDLIKLLVGAGVSVGTALVLANPLSSVTETILAQPEAETQEDDESIRWGMVIDLSKCIGCEYCVYACQATNDTTDEMRWNIHHQDQTPTGDIFHVTRPCLHCQYAPCVSVCPVGATYLRDDGLVVMDYDKCIGCRYCQTACPYGARSFNWTDRGDIENEYVPDWGTPEVARRARGVVEKCTFCIHRIDTGVPRGLTPGVDVDATPACVNICPVEARHFGNLNDPNSPVSKIISTMPTFRLREDLGTDASVFYIPPEGLVI